MPTTCTKLSLKAEKTVAIGVEGKDYLVMLREQIGDKRQYSQVWLYDYKEVGKRHDNATHSLTRWLQVIKNDSLFPELRAVGVIGEAEQGSAATTLAIKTSLEAAGYSAPDEPTKWTNSTPSTGFLIIPHNSPQGCLEHALLSAPSTKSTPLLACAEQLLRCAEPVYTRAYPGRELLNWRAKYRCVRSWLPVERRACKQVIPARPGIGISIIQVSKQCSTFWGRQTIDRWRKRQHSERLGFAGWWRRRTSGGSGSASTSRRPPAA